MKISWQYFVDSLILGFVKTCDELGIGQVSSLLFIATPTSGKKKLEDLDSSTLVDLIKDYMIENEDLR